MTLGMLLAAALLFALAGFVAGAITGLVPGLHVNNVALVVLASQSAFAGAAAACFPGASGQDVALLLASFVVGVAVTHAFVSAIPSTFLGMPDEGTSLSALPAHRLALKGNGFQAVAVSASGSLAGLAVSVALVAPVFAVMGRPLGGYEALVQGSVAMILVAVVALLILNESPRAGQALRIEGIIVKGGDEPTGEIARLEANGPARVEGVVVCAAGAKDFWLRGSDGKIRVTLRFGSVPAAGECVSVAGKARRDRSLFSSQRQMAKALLVFVLAGALGAALLVPEGVARIWPTPIEADEGAVLLLPLFAGLFGLPTLLESLRGQGKVPPQDTRSKSKLGSWRRLRAALSGSLAGCFSGWLPGISGAVATAVSDQLPGKGRSDDPEEYVFMVSAVNAANAVFNLLALFVLLKARSGAMKAVQGLLGRSEAWTTMGDVPTALLALLVSALVVGCMAYVATLFLGRRFAKLVSRVRYVPLAVGVACMTVAMVAVFSGALGLLILAVAVPLGSLPRKLGVRRVHLMGCLIVPTLTFLL
jgi:TctA family transporter